MSVSVPLGIREAEERTTVGGVSPLGASPASAAYSLMPLQFFHRRVPESQLFLGDCLADALPECPVPWSVLGRTAEMSPGRLFP